MIVRLLRRAAIAALITAAAPAPGHALSFDRVPGLDEIAVVSSLVFRGRVVRIEHGSVGRGTTKGAVGFPYTETTFIVEDGIVGARTGETLTLRQMGGQSPERPELVALVPGLPDFQLGGRYVVFANDRIHPLFGAAWGERGALRVVEDTRGEARVLDHTGRLLAEWDDGRISGLHGLRCDAIDGPRCERWISAEDADAAGEDAREETASLAEPLTPARLAARVRALRSVGTGVDRGPARTVTLDRASFEATLGRSFTR